MTKIYNIALSVFFPCYNEELNLENLVFETTSILVDLVKKYEILIINDGSTDRTGFVADQLSKKLKHVRVIHHQKNNGYGAALVTGFANSVNDWIFFTDGDHQFFLNDIKRLISIIDHYDLIIGFRKNRRDPWHRIFYSMVWNRLVRILFNLKVKDVNCAFKLIKKEKLDDVVLCSSGAAISAELLVKLTLSRARIKEVGVAHRPRIHGSPTGGSPKVILKAFWEIFKLYKSKRSLGETAPWLTVAR